MSALLPTRIVEKPWGRTDLPPPFACDGRRVGEIWFEPPRALESLLVKYLFTSERLSVQVHPPGPQGKDECWFVVEAEPGAELGLGFLEDVSPARLREAALDGSIEQLLAWYPVEAGEFIYIPAGTVHAIGGGLTVIELQQNSDITYRLYDYGRPRELHLDRGLAVAHCGRHDPGLRRKLPASGAVTLASGPYFALSRVEGSPTGEACAPLLVVPLHGSVEIAGEPVQPGQCGLADTPESLSVAPDAQCLLAWAC